MGLEGERIARRTRVGGTTRERADIPSNLPGERMRTPRLLTRPPTLSWLHRGDDRAPARPAWTAARTRAPRGAVPSRPVAVVFVLPQPAIGQLGPVAAYLSTGGWAEAAARVLGMAWIVTPWGILEPAEVLRRGAGPRPRRAPSAVPPTVTTGRARAGAALRRHAPTVVKTAVKDVRQLGRARRFTIDRDGPWSGSDVDFVWQRHGLFETAGLDLADQLGRPSVLFVPATKVWEAERWGTHRPGWGALVERTAERPALVRADVVACGSSEVAEQAERIGTPPERIVITPTGVDVDRFTDAASRREEVRARLGLTGRFVVGWAGSFRPFHALERAVDAVDGLPDTTLLLLGDGPERDAVEALAADRGVPAVFTGTVDHRDLPAYLAAMDAGLVLASDGGFHYSPLKLAEYLAAGLAVVAPDVEPVATRLTHDEEVLLVEPGDASSLRAALDSLRTDEDRRRRLGRAGCAAARDRLSWDHQVRRVVDALPSTPRSSRPAG